MQRNAATGAISPNARFQNMLERISKTNARDSQTHSETATAGRCPADHRCLRVNMRCTLMTDQHETGSGLEGSIRCYRLMEKSEVAVFRPAGYAAQNIKRMCRHLVS